MNLVVMHNPIAGAGKAGTASEDLVAALRAEGHEVATLTTTPGANDANADAAWSDAEGLVVVGGDGTIRGVLPLAMEHGVPIYQVPLGTENLFAREFGMDRKIATLMRAIERRQPAAVDVGLVNDQPFALMVSVGFDAEVVHDLLRHRNGSISHWSYVPPILRQLREWRPPELRITVDGSPVGLDGPGMVVVANCRQYGFRFDPAVRASMTDGLLDLVFLPVRSRLGLLNMIIRCRARRHLRHPGVRYVTGRSIRVECETPQRFQVDGDGLLDPESAADQPPTPQTTPLEISVRPRVLRVLTPRPHPPARDGAA